MIAGTCFNYRIFQQQILNTIYIITLRPFLNVSLHQPRRLAPLYSATDPGSQILAVSLRGLNRYKMPPVLIGALQTRAMLLNVFITNLVTRRIDAVWSLRYYWGLNRRQIHPYTDWHTAGASSAALAPLSFNAALCTDESRVPLLTIWCWFINTPSIEDFSATSSLASGWLLPKNFTPVAVASR